MVKNLPASGTSYVEPCNAERGQTAIDRAKRWGIPNAT
jgi:hypothetical protein